MTEPQDINTAPQAGADGRVPGEPGSPAIRTESLKKVFRDFWRRPKVRAVDGIDMEVRSGEIFGLLGPNGSGKSTFIKLLLGLLFPTAGTIRVLGRPPRSVAVKSRIGYLPEESHLYGYLNAGETLDFYGRLFGLEKRKRHERVEELLDMAGLRHAAARPVGEYSKGMARRIGFAQALINNPDLVILDEPTSGLDPIGCRQVKDLMLTLARRGKTILMCSHLLADVEDVCDRIAILYNGRILAQGPVNELLRKEEKLTLTTGTLPPEIMKKVVALIREKTGQEASVEHPKMNLEQFFLQVVEEARKLASAPSGASRSTGIPGFLAND
ncbi:MAG: ABC transporter ATP-binding protein [Kiritimatiellia bacterium]